MCLRVKKGKLGFQGFYEVNLRLKAVGTWIDLALFIGDQRILTLLTPPSVTRYGDFKEEKEEKLADKEIVS